jgi:raffinose/stachyose/melibiose transport system permease protein
MYRVSRVIALVTFAAMILLPSLIVVLGSFKTDAEVYNKPLSLPDAWSLDNYRRLLSDSDLDVSFRNSVFVTVTSVVLTLILASLASFAIARMITVSGKVLAGLFALGLAIPAQINLVPIYYIFKDLGLTNSFIGLILINVTTTLPISIFILSAFFRQVSKEMYEASEVDGASPFRIYRAIALPLSRPAMGATAIFLFVINWNDLLWPLLLIQESGKKTLPLAMLAYRGEYFVSFSMLFTAVMVASLPMVIMYLFMQRSFIAPQRAARIATQLVELIDLQKLNPGDRLPPERQLADLLEVSRPSLREALHILQAQGLVQIKHGQGTFVQEPLVAQELRASMMATTHGLNELFDAREVLEVPASKWAADKASKEDIRLLRATLNQIETVTATTPVDFDQLQLLDAKFHLTIVGIAGNRFINQTLNVLQDVMKMSMETTLRLPGRSDVSKSEHNAILAAIESGNGELAAKLTLQHITGARVVALADAKEKNKP